MSCEDDETEKIRITEEGEVINVSAIISENENCHELHHTYEFLTKIEPVGIFKSTKKKSIDYNDSANEREYTAHCSNVGSSSAKELKAEVMNMPYLDDEHDIFYGKTLSPPLKSSFSTITDVVEKLKEAYRACNCRVCRCVGLKYVTKTNTEENCECKKCDFDRCTDTGTVIDSDAFNNRYFINSHRDISKNNKVCDCIVCKCIVCEGKSESMMDCNCIYCKCIVCKPQST